MPEEQETSIQSDLPVKGTNVATMQKQLESFLPYGVGNTHPRFFGWVHGAGAPSGLMAEIAAAAMYVNAGGRDHVAPVPLNICCFRYKFDNDSDALNEEIVVRLQESGIAVPSTTIINGQLAIRVNLTNHRTKESDLDMLVEAVVRIGGALA